MAKQIGLQIKGRIDEYSFYRDRLHGYLVRRTGGMTSQHYQTDERYASTRAASSEFSLVSSSGKLIRGAFGAFAAQVKDGTMTNRMNKELTALKQLDNQHVRGERRPETMMADPDVNQWFRIFQFNERVKIYDISRHAINRVSTVCDVTLLASAFPEGATHAGLTLVRSVIDFEKECFETRASEMLLVSKLGPQQGLVLHFPVETNRVPSALEGVEIVCLQVLFYKEVNGKPTALTGRVHGMGVISIAKLSGCATLNGLSAPNEQTHTKTERTELQVSNKAPKLSSFRRFHKFTLIPDSPPPMKGRVRIEKRERGIKSG